MNEMIRLEVTIAFEIHKDKLRIFPIPTLQQGLRGNSLISGSSLTFSATTANISWNNTAAITGSATTGSGASFVINSSIR